MQSKKRKGRPERGILALLIVIGFAIAWVLFRVPTILPPIIGTPTLRSTIKPTLTAIGVTRLPATPTPTLPLNTATLQRPTFTRIARTAKPPSPNQPVVIPVGKRPTDIGVNAITNTIYVSNSDDESLSVIDGNTNTVITTIPIGHKPMGLGINPTTNTIYARLDDSDSLSVIDGNTNTLITTIPGQAQGSSYLPDVIAVNAATNTIYVPNNSHNVSVIDGNTNTILTTLNVWYFNDVGVNPITNMVYVTTAGGVSVINGKTNAVTTTIPIGTPPDFACGGTNTYCIGTDSVASDINPTTNSIYVGDQNGTITIIDGKTNAITAVMPDQSLGILDRIKVNSITNIIYVTYFDSLMNARMSVIDGGVNTIGKIIPLGKSPVGLGLNPNTNMVYITHYGDNTVSVFQATR